MKLSISVITLLLALVGHSQIIDLSEDQLLRSGNVFLKKFNTTNTEVKGNRFLEEKFQRGSVLFSNDKK